MNQRQRKNKRLQAKAHNESNRVINSARSEETEKRSKLHEAAAQLRAKVRTARAKRRAVREKKRLKRQTIRRANKESDPTPSRDKMMGLTKVKSGGDLK